MNVIEKLLVVQQHDCKIREIEKELRDVPRRKEDEQKRLKEHTELLAKAEATLKSRLADTKKFELEGQARKEKIEKLRTQQFEIKTNKEFKTIESEIKGINEGISRLEDQQLEAMGEVEKAKEEVQQRKSALELEEKAVLNDVGLLDKRVAALDDELKKVKEIRAVAANEVDSKWLAQYNRIFGRKDRGLVQIEDGVCGGCHMALPPAVVHRAKRMDNNMVVCDFCGRLLY